MKYGIEKINSKWIENLNIRPEIINFLEENIDGKFININLSNVFVDLAPKTGETKAKINRQDYIRLKASAQ